MAVETALEAFAREREGEILHYDGGTEVRWPVDERTTCLVRFEERSGVPVSLAGAYQGDRASALLSSLHFESYDSVAHLSTLADTAVFYMGELYVAAYRRRWFSGRR